MNEKIRYLYLSLGIVFTILFISLTLSFYKDIIYYPLYETSLIRSSSILFALFFSISYLIYGIKKEK